MDETITWRPVAEQLPDADTTVLMFDGEAVNTGFLDCADWRYAASGGLCPFVSHWADLPGGPAA